MPNDRDLEIDADYILNGTLKVEDTFYGDVLCRCSRCNGFSVYKKATFTPAMKCKICKVGFEAKKNIDPTTDMKTCLRMIDNKMKGKFRDGSKAITSSKVYGRYQIGQVINEMRIQGFVGRVKKGSYTVDFSEPTDVVMSCIYCDYYSRMVDIKDLDKYVDTEAGLELRCPYCSKEMKTIADEVKAFRNAKASKEQRKLDKQDTKLASKASDTKTGSQLIQKIKSPFDNVKSGSKVDKLITKVKELNTNLNIQDIEPIGSAYRVICCCEKCGTEVVIPSNKVNGPVACPGCDELKTDINYVGSYNKEYVGTTKNLLELVERNGDTCKVRCINCGREHENIRFYDWYKNKVICNCNKNKITDEIICNNCGEYINVNLKDMIMSKDAMEEIVCKHCGKPSGISIQEVIDDYITTPSMSATTSKKLGVARNKIKQTTTVVDDELVKSKEPLYIGTDGNMYYKCICMKHNTSMILSDSEIEMFNHAACKDGRQHILKDIIKDNIS
jgi:hypothetical protein